MPLRLLQDVVRLRVVASSMSCLSLHDAPALLRGHRLVLLNVEVELFDPLLRNKRLHCLESVLHNLRRRRQQLELGVRSVTR